MELYHIRSAMYISFTIFSLYRLLHLQSFIEGIRLCHFTIARHHVFEAKINGSNVKNKTFCDCAQLKKDCKNCYAE